MAYQQYPSQPGQQPSMPPGVYAPPPPKKKGVGAKIGIGCGGAFGALVLIGVIAAAMGGGDTGTQAENKPVKASAAPAKERAKADAEPAEAKPQEKPKEKPKAAPRSPADQFKAFVAKNGSANEKAAIGHVTKVQGAEEQNDILDSVDIYTDFTGGLMGPHQSEGKLIASAFADWKDSKNGLVTIYDVKGELLANCNF
ncbi:hypothetical protein SLV14_006621 [Streptomyces sp. Je 1-4]|uniref:hypothetical protein n=1 Tax=Streptomyces TaxID=1883 RepID=UPI0021D953FB|nr:MULTISPECIES: hypothetical protein [unclassified Streptomyces]UYB43622.1 hypothetical protein SLV14_006621 [Streptomyces sp. Je 1-4]UZQ40015.1 hypothetical protein SLV14N_006621 [Streptomyces sp. Je 1-4] [Streptomyces sp. Je 1-4 4N24]UZQ47432.1 hypothetical protein SLV14NA_006621 [Streptomyces sp. Je 1-4] [Streptomyces sp. Je 1-4 4N24_ara]